jgi:hypothetical protein
MISCEGLKSDEIGKTFNVAFASIYSITKNQNVYHLRYMLNLIGTYFTNKIKY